MSLCVNDCRTSSNTSVRRGGAASGCHKRVPCGHPPVLMGGARSAAKVVWKPPWALPWVIFCRCWLRGPANQCVELCEAQKAVVCASPAAESVP